MMMDLTSNSFETICRLCLRGRELVPIRETIVEDIKVSYLIEYSVSLEVSREDSMPSNVCNNCLTDLYTVYKFKKRCHDIDENLKLIAENVEEVIKIQILESDEEEIVQHSFECSTCNQCFKTFKESVDHKRQERHAEFTKIVCEVCGKTYERRKKSMHIKVHHKDKTVKRNRKRIFGGKFPFMCLTCNERFSTAQESLDHKKKQRHGKYADTVCEICGKTFPSGKRSVHMATYHAPKKFKCYICNAMFNIKANLRRHLTMHTGEKHFMCSICGQPFTRKENLTNHEKLHNISLGNFKCTLCQVTFNRKSFIRKHMKTQHSTEDSQTLNSFIHTDNPPQFSCKECGRVFKRKSNLQVHVRLHTGELPYKCDFCSFRCRQKSQIILHTRLHTGEKPFSCPYCNKSFTVKQNMRCHMRTHTGEKPFKCTDCGKQYSHSSNLKKHKASHLKSTLEVVSADENYKEEEDDANSIIVEHMYQFEEDESKIGI